MLKRLERPAAMSQPAANKTCKVSDNHTIVIVD